MIIISSVLVLGLFQALPEVQREYEAAVIRTSSDAAAQVRLALWCEANGLTTECKIHLEQALKADPSHPTARGLLGLVDDGGRLARPDEITRRIQSDSALSQLLSEYETRRDAARDTTADHMKLARWCESVGLTAEAQGHYAAVTRLDPNHAAAWKKFGCQLHEGRWLTHAQIAAEVAEAAAQTRADATWTPLLLKWKRWLRDEQHDVEAAKKLSEVRDPRAVPSIVRTLADGTSWEQDRAVKMLARIDSSAAARALADLAVGGRTSQVRENATEALRRSDPSDYMDFLISAFRDPFRYRATDVKSPTQPGVLIVDRPAVIERRIYEAPSVQVGAITAVAGPNQQIIRGSNQPAVDDGVRRSVAATEKQLKSDQAKLDQRNSAIQARNREIQRVLSRVTGHDYGPDRIVWTSWWVDQKGESYKSPEPPSAKPTVVNVVPILYVPPVIAPLFVINNLNVPTRSHHSCFGAGTLVLTLKGHQPIETVQVGDLVLTQDLRTGAVGYEPVVAALKNPPAPTLKLELDRGESIITTGIHRFWTPGLGWTIARELKVGDRVRTLDGPARIVAIESQPVRPVFNLEVSQHANFFVGRSSILVHDHSTAQPVPQPFDALGE